MRKIAFITDLHLDEQFPLDNNVIPPKNFERVIADIESQNINDIIFGGDIGESTAHKYFFDKLNKFAINLVLGNHDKFEQVTEHFSRDKNQLELFYKTADENYQYIFLDTSFDEISQTQLDWLKNELNEDKELIVFIHHPILEIETPVDKLYPLKNRAELKAILLTFKKSVTVFCGHYHMNDEQVYKNIKQYTTQSMCFQIVKSATKIEIDNKNFGYRIIEIQNEKIETELINFKQ